MNALSSENIKPLIDDIYKRITDKTSKKDLSNAKKYARQYCDAQAKESLRRDDILSDADKIIATEEKVGHIKSSDKEGCAKVDHKEGTITINPKHAILEEFEATQWFTGQSYPINTIVGHKNKKYICTTEHISSSSNAPGQSKYWYEIVTPNLYGETNGELQVTIDVNEANKDVYLPINYNQNRMPFPHISINKVINDNNETKMSLKFYDLKDQIAYATDVAEITSKGINRKEYANIPVDSTKKIGSKYLTQYKAFCHHKTLPRIKSTSTPSDIKASIEGSIFYYHILNGQNRKYIYLMDNNKAYGRDANDDVVEITSDWTTISDEEKIASFEKIAAGKDLANYFDRSTANVRVLTLHDTPQTPELHLGFDYMYDPLIFPTVVIGQIGQMKSIKTIPEGHSVELIVDGEIYCEAEKGWCTEKDYYYSNERTYYKLPEIKGKKVQPAIIMWWQSDDRRDENYIEGLEITFIKPPIYRNIIVGKDYNYEYVANNVLKVSFTNSGKYVINYSS